jgi:predicted PurR-regulated permease PerM
MAASSLRRRFETGAGIGKVPQNPDFGDYITDMREANRHMTTSDRLTTVLSYGALLLLIYLVFLILSPFFVPLAWSAVLAIFFYSLYRPVERRLGATRAAVICTLGVTLLLIMPVLLVMTYAAREALDASARFQGMLGDGTKLVPVEAMNWVRGHLPEAWQNMDFVSALRQGAEKVASYLAGSMGSLLKNLFSFFVNLFILLFALFFMFRDGDAILRAVRHMLPFERELQDSMVTESGDLIFASVAVALLIAIIQGLLGGLAFAFTGLGAPVFMGVLIAFFSIVPVVGSALIWFPAAGWLAFQGHWGKALLVLLICGGVAGVADNIVRPLLLRNRTRLNDLLLFISILGGLDVFGLLGLVAGPTIVAAALGVFRVYVAHRDELEKEAA